MRRSPFVIVATVAGLAGVLTFHARRPSGGLSAAGANPSSGSPGGAGGTPSSSPPSSASSSTTAPAPSSGTRSAKGSVIKYGYGELAVRVTETGSRVTDVRLTTLLTADQYSQSIADQVAPTLAHEVLNAQSARIQTISGATYTSEAYAQSVQSALDALRR